MTDTTGDRGSIGFLHDYLSETPLWRIAGPTMIVLTWGLLALLLYEGYSRVRDGEHLVDSVIADFNMLNTRHLEAYAQTQKVIEDLLNELLDETGADRAMLLLLHNGKNSVGGIPFLSISGYAEAYRDGMSAAVFHIDGVPLSAVSALQETLAGETVAYRPNDTREGAAVESVGVDRVLRGPVIRSFEGVPHGWIFLGYTDAGWEASGAGRPHEQRMLERYTDILTGVLNAVNLTEIVGELADKRR